MEEIDSVLVDNVKSFSAGGFGGICAVITGHPFDLIKVLLQTNQYKNSIDAIKSTLSKHGPLGLYKGVTSPLLGVTPMFAVSFWGYDLGKKLVIKYGNGKGNSNSNGVNSKNLSILQISTAGFFSAIPTTLIAAPFERVKVVMQTTKENVSFGKTVKNLYLQGGLKSIFKGSMATLARDGPGSAVYFATYEFLKENLSKSNKNNELSLSAIMISGGFAGVAMWTTIFPVDTIKSIQQSSSVKQTMLQIATKLYKTKGVGGFFPGIGPALARSFPANAATFLGVEFAKNLMEKI